MKARHKVMIFMIMVILGVITVLLFKVSQGSMDSILTTAEFKEMTGVSRKYTIPIFEYFDSMQITMRVGEKRVLRVRA